MRKVLVATAATSLFVAGLTAPAQAAIPEMVASTVSPNTNPSIKETCGLDATLILDASGSIQSAGAVNTVRNAGKDLMFALKDTNSTLRITQFATFSGELSGRVPVNSTTTGSGGALANGLTKYYTPPPPRPAGVTIYNGGSIENNALTWTNWEDGIKGIDRPELAIFMTDGDPTAYNASATRTNVNTSSTGTALDNAITQANILKAAGTRVLVVGVGSGLTSAASQDRLKKISGPQLEKSPAALVGKTINEVDAVAFSDFAALGAFMRSVVTSLCGNSVTVQKLAQSAADAEYLPTTGWDITVAPTVSGGFTWVDPLGPDNSAQTKATAGAQGSATFQWKPKVADQKVTVKVTEAVKTDFSADRWSCDIKAADGTTTTESGSITSTPSFQFFMSASEIAACQIYNDFNYASGISITKEAADNPVRGNADGWHEVYTFAVKNTGNAPLTVVKPVDPKCSSISAASGPGTATGLLQPGNTWTYTCQAKIGPVATVTTSLNVVNTVSVVGIDPDGNSVSAQDNETVAVKTPRIQIDKTAKETVSGDEIADGGSVTAGTQVTYMYAVTNTGNDILSLTRATAVTDDKCQTVAYVSGDTGNDEKLDLGETWQYTCTKVLDPPGTVTSVTNRADVTAQWSNPQNRQQNDAAVTDTDRMTIDINRAANLRIVKVTNPGDIDQNFGFSVTGPGVAPADQAFNLNTSTDPATAPASRELLLDGPVGGGSQYTITEAGTTGWDLTDIECSKAPDTTTATAVTLTILPTEDVTCAFTNERLPSLMVAKETSPAGSTAEFGFTTSPALSPPFKLSDGQSKTFDALSPGQVTITEADVPTGWNLDDISCSGTTIVNKDVTAGAVTVDLAYGEQAQCLYTNGELAPATLTIVKDDVTATWDPDFPFGVKGPALDDPFTLKLGDSVTYTVHPGIAGDKYTVTEQVPGPTPPTGESRFDLTSIECVIGDPQNPITGDVATGVVEVPLLPGDAAVCTYTNQQLPRLTVVKNAIPIDDPADTTEFTFDTNGLTPDTFSLTHAQQQVFTNVSQGTALTVTEAPTVDWTLTSLECTGNGADGLSTDLANSAVSGDLEYGADVVCTYVNTQEPPKAYLFVAKYADPATSTQQFDFTAIGPNFDEVFTLEDGDFAGFEVDPGTYTVTEAATPGWEITELYCVNSTNPTQPVYGDPDTGVTTIALLDKEVGVCAYTNSQLASLAVDKVTDVASLQEFPFTAISQPAGILPATFTLIGGGTPQAFSGISAGTEITIKEDVPTATPPRWSLADIECDGTANSPSYAVDGASVTLGAGEDADCTFFNSQVPPATVQIVKAADPADGTEFNFTAAGADGGVLLADRSFTLKPDGDIDVKTLTVYPNESGEQFRFAEPTVPADWNLTDVACVDEGSPVGTADFTAAGGHVDVVISPGATITCTFGNRSDATLTVIKEAPHDPQQSFDFSWDADTPAMFSLKDQGTNQATGLEPNAYTVYETDLPQDWYLSGPEGAHPTCTGTHATVDYTVDLGAKLTLAAGEDAVCTFANFFDYRPEIELEKTPSRTVVLDGGEVTYTYVLRNTGTVDLVAVGAVNDVVADDQCDAVTRVLGSGTTLAPQETWTFECTVAPMAVGKATNQATATLRDPKTDETVQAKDERTVEVQVPDLDVVKTSDQPVVYPGTDVTYTYVATNIGETAFEGPLDLADWISDDQCAPVTYVSGDAGVVAVMDLGEAWTYTCTTTLNVDTINTVTFTGTPFIPASVDSGAKQTGDPLAVDDSAEVAVITKAIDIAKSAAAPGGVIKDGVLLVPQGSEVTYTYRVTTGAATVPMRVLDVTDNKCAPVEYQSGDTNSDGLVDLNETWVYTCTSTFTGVATVKNTVVVTAVEPIVGGLATAEDSAVVRSYKGSIAIQKTPNVTLVPKGEPVTYTYVVRNSGSADLADVAVSDDKCAALVYRSGDDADGVMKPGEEWIYTCVHPLQDDTTNTADVTAKTPGGGAVTDSSSATVLVVGGQLKPGIGVSKTPSVTTVAAGGAVTYRYEVRNTATMPLANIRLVDDKCSPVSYVSGDDNGDGLLTSSSNGEGWPDETWVYTCSTTLRSTTTNTVTATGSPWHNGQIIGADVSAQASATVTVPGRKPLPIDVDAVKKCKGDTCRLVEKSKTNKHGQLRFRTRCRPIGSAADGEVRYCRTKVTKRGSVTVRVIGYPKVKVTVWIQARPKQGSRQDWKPSSWRRSWIIRT